MQKTKRPLWLTAALAAFLVAVAVAGCKHDEEDEWTPLTIRGTVLEKYAGQRKSVTIPDGVTGIGSRAFSGSDVAEVVIPPFVTSIAADAFNDSKVESVSYIGSQEDWQKLVGNGLPDGIQVACFITDENGILIRYEGDETDVVIPAGFVKGIAGGVFRDCAVRTGITGVTVPGSVKHIGENAFADCTALADVRIEAGVADIGAGAFAGCTALEALNIPAGVTGLGERIVSGCDCLTELVVHESVTTIAPGAFTGIGRKEITYRAKKAKWEKLVADTGIRQDLAGFTVHCTDGDWNGPEQTATTPGDNTGDTHEHIWGKYIIDGAADGHYQTCKVKGCTARTPTETHVYDDEDDAECNVCGYLKENPGDPTCEHVFDYKEIDDGYHTKTCMKNCGASSTETHNYGTVTYQKDGHHQTCTDCNHLKIESHKYDGAAYENNGADGHSRTCTTEGCGYIETGVHSLGECESDGKGGHQKTCTAGCGYSEPVPHDWRDGYTTDADKHYKTCKIAGCTARDKEGTHQYEGEPYKDDGTGKHYRECKVCDYPSKSVSHDWSEIRTDDAGEHFKICTTERCGYTELVEHKWSGEYEKDTDNHYKVCIVEGCTARIETARHVYGNDDDGECTVCGYRKAIPGKPDCEHNLTMEYTEKGHYNKCTLCSYRSELVDHTWSKYENNGADGHSRTCTTEGCGYTDSGVHSLGECESDGNGGHQKTCTAKCGYSVSVSHDWNTTYTTDADKHYKTCKIVGCTARDKEGTHQYEGEPYKDDGTGKHYRVCKVCDYPSESVPHDWSGYTKDDDTTHSRTCTTEGCGYIETGVHSLGECESDGNGGHQKTCTAKCGYSVSVSHDWRDGYTTDADKHYKTCNIAGCTAHDEEGAHQYSVTYQKDGHHQTCTVCTHTKIEEHKYEGASFVNGGEVGHYQTCTATGCDAHSESTPHDPQYEKIDDSKHRVTCKATGCDYSSNKPHTITGYDSKDDDEHYKICEICKERMAVFHNYEYTDSNDSTHTKVCKDCKHSVPENHHYDDDADTVCNDCGYKRPLPPGDLKIEGGTLTIDNNGEVTGYVTDSSQDSPVNVDIPDGVTGIKDGAFGGTWNLGTVTIPGSVESIGGNVFAHSSIQEVKIDGVNTIGDNAFNGCYRLTDVTIANGTKTIGKNAFEGCGKLETVVIPGSVTSIGDNAFKDCKGLTSVSITNGVNTIGDGAFQGCEKLETVTIPGSVTSIGDNAFDGCGLTRVTIADGVNTIGKEAFKGCEKLEAVAIPGSVTSIGDNAFNGCGGLTSVTIADGVTSIGSGAFAGCGEKFTSITIPGSVTSIGNGAFQNCNGLTKAVIENGVKEIAVDMFEGCHKLESVEIPQSVESIESGAFKNCSSLKEVNSLDGVKNIGSMAFQFCHGLESITIPTSVETIGEAAFAGSGLRTVKITEGVKYIVKGAFQGCGNLTRVEIPKSVESIGYHAFLACANLTTIIFNGTQTEWNALVGTDNIGLGAGVTVECTDGTITTP